LKISRSEVEITVLSEGRTGILGLGAEDARISVRPILKAEPPDTAEVAEEVLEKILSGMGISASIQVESVTQMDSSAVLLDIRGDDLGILIGRRGSTLAALQYLVGLVVSHRMGGKTAVTVDVEGYRRRREESLRSMAQRIAERVRTSGQSITMEPMPAAERRIIHLALQDSADVTTQSIGEGETRKVVITPKRR